MIDYCRSTVALLLFLGLVSCDPVDGHERLVIVRAAGDGSGAVRDPAGSVHCLLPSDEEGCQFYLPESQPFLDLEAIPQENSIFTGWTVEPGYESASACAGESSRSCHQPLEQADPVLVRPRFDLPGVVIVKVVGSGTITGPKGIVCLEEDAGGDDCRASFPTGESITVTATGAGFTGWSGHCVPTGASCAVLTGGMREVTAYFGTPAPALHRLTLLPNGPRPGRIREVVAAPGNLDCTWDGTVRTGVCERKFPLGASVDLVTVRQPGDTIVSFGPGSCSLDACTVTILSDRSLSAEFRPRLSRLTVLATASVNRSGRITSAEAGIDCTFTAAHYAQICGEVDLLYGTQVTLRLRPDPLGRAGGTPCSDGDGYCVSTSMQQDRQIYFSVSNRRHFLTLRGGSDGVSGLLGTAGWGLNGSLWLSPTTIYRFYVDSTDTITLTPQSYAGSTFREWGGACTGAAVPCVLQVNGDLDVSVTFDP
jgi:hypothetical protein